MMDATGYQKPDELPCWDSHPHLLDASAGNRRTEESRSSAETDLSQPHSTEAVTYLPVGCSFRFFSFRIKELFLQLNKNMHNYGCEACLAHCHMTEYDRGDLKATSSIFMKVHDYAASLSAFLKDLTPRRRIFLNPQPSCSIEVITLTNRNTVPCNSKVSGKKTGEARKLMEGLGDFTKRKILRICYLIGHHHTVQSY